jgi:hypothetical protein
MTLTAGRGYRASLKIAKMEVEVGGPELLDPPPSAAPPRIVDLKTKFSRDY